MASRKQHCEDCIQELGEPFECVHQWLDALFDYEVRELRHRIFRHNRKGVEEVRQKWGDKAAEAAKIHIWRDYGLPKDDTLIPADEKEAAIVLATWIVNQQVRRDQANPLYDNNPYEES